MIIPSLLFSFFLGIYLFFTVLIILGLRKQTPERHNQWRPRVAVIISARNEASNLGNLLNDLEKQSYPRNLLEVIIADDRSTDDTWQIISEHSRKVPNISGLRIHAASTTLAPKKFALTQCIRKTQAEIIFQTDGDCRVGSEWVASGVENFDAETQLVLGYVNFKGHGFLSRYQALDFLALVAANVGMLQKGKIWSGSGSNLAYRRSAFTAIGGFEQSAGQMADDDIFLIQSIAKLPHAKVHFSFDPRHHIFTNAPETLTGFLNQRIRWASNSRGLEKREFLFWFFLLSAFMTNLALLVGGILGLHELPRWAILKFIFEGAVLLTAGWRFKQFHGLLLYPLWFLLQPIYIPYVAIMGLLGKFEWKQ